MSIYIITHKDVELPKYDNYIPMQVGENKHDISSYMRDDFGENIADKNSSYCELTGIYAIWKNVKDENIIGIVHYRRYFFSTRISKCFENILSYDEIERILKDYDLILPEKHFFKQCVKKQYSNIHNYRDLEICREVISEFCPNYLDAFDEMLFDKYIFPFNMFIMKRYVFDEYATWLFSILFEVEKRIDIDSYDTYNQRVFGFLSERLFNVWIKHQHYRYVSVSVHNIEMNRREQWSERMKNQIKKELSRIKW